MHGNEYSTELSVHHHALFVLIIQSASRPNFPLGSTTDAWSLRVKAVTEQDYKSCGTVCTVFTCSTTISRLLMAGCKPLPLLVFGHAGPFVDKVVLSSGINGILTVRVQMRYGRKGALVCPILFCR